MESKSFFFCGSSIVGWITPMAGLYLRSVEVYDSLLKKVPPRETVRSL